MSKETYFYDGEVTRSMISGGHQDTLVHAHTQQDVEPVANLANLAREDNEVIGHRKSRNMIPVAEVPMIIYEQAFREGWHNDKKKWRQWLNNPDNKIFRITDGRM